MNEMRIFENEQFGKVMESVSMDLEEAGLYLLEMMERENPSKGGAPHVP